MSDLDLLRTTAAQILADAGKRPTGEVAVDGAMWRSLTETGFVQLLIPESAGGSGGTLDQALAVLLEAGRAAAPVPYAETAVLAARVCAQTGLALPDGVVTCVLAGPGLHVESVDGAWRIDGVATRVPWASAASALVVVAPLPDGSVALTVDAEAISIERGHNLAGEPRDTVRFDNVRVTEGVTAAADLAEQAVLLGALSRTVLIAGALQTVLAMTQTHVIDRVQFGRPLAAFQVVKQQVAELAGEVAAVSVAADAAGTDLDPLAVAAAKIAAARAAGVVETIAHQLHGAIGFTEEHALHLFTQRVLSWRDEYGTQAWWESRLGRLVAAGGADQLWPSLTGRPRPPKDVEAS